MGILQPESGLLFWMTLAFASVFLVVAKFGFPVILRALDERKEFIDNSLNAAREAQQQLASIEAKSEAILTDAENQRTEMLRQMADERTRLLAQTHEEVESERQRLLQQTRTEAEAERQQLLQEAQQQVSLLAIAVAERMLRCNLENREEQSALAQRILNEMDDTKVAKYVHRTDC